ncbi:MAG: hypothetical protein ACFFC7_25160, partial [Candidatus Hermodarchaeota archaeon]
AELLYAKKEGYDCVIAHHPVGSVDTWRVFLLHMQQLEAKGVPHEEAEQVVLKKINLLKFALHARNYDATPAFARQLELPFLNIHCPSDELGRRRIHAAITELVEEKGNPVLGDLRPHLEKKFVEFKKAKTKVEIAKGAENDSLGNWVFSHGALTNGGFEIAECYYRHGVDTVLYIHINPSDLVKIRELGKGSLVVTGHIVSDSVGINPFLDRLEELGCELTVIGGQIR